MSEETNLRNATYFRGQTCEFTIELGLNPGRRRPNLEIGERALGHFILPPFQRPSVWTQEQQIRFVESIWMRLPIPAYVFNLTSSVGEGAKTDYWLIDGQQRWTSVVDYVNDKFPVMGYLWSEVGEVDRRFFENRPWTSIRTEYTDEAVLREVYDRLAYGGTAHEPSDRKTTTFAPTMR